VAAEQGVKGIVAVKDQPHQTPISADLGPRLTTLSDAAATSDRIHKIKFGVGTT